MTRESQERYDTISAITGIAAVAAVAAGPPSAAPIAGKMAFAVLVNGELRRELVLPPTAKALRRAVAREKVRCR